MRIRIAIVCVLAAVVAGSAARVESAANDGSATLEFEVLGMHCGACADRARDTLREIPGVGAATVEFDSRRGSVTASGPVEPADVRRALGELGFEARFGGEALDSDPLPAEVRAGLDIETVSRGETVRIKKVLAPGKITIFDYYADWCGPCHLLSPKLERLLLRYDGLALRKVDIVDFDSAAARQATREFRLPGLPFTRVFDARGKLLGEVHGNDADAVEALLAPHARKRPASAGEEGAR